MTLATKDAIDRLWEATLNADYIWYVIGQNEEETQSCYGTLIRTLGGYAIVRGEKRWNFCREDVIDVNANVITFGKLPQQH